MPVAGRQAVAAHYVGATNYMSVWRADSKSTVHPVQQFVPVLSLLAFKRLGKAYYRNFDADMMQGKGFAQPVPNLTFFSVYQQARGQRPACGNRLVNTHCA